MNKPNRNLVLTGFMGTGKSHVAELVAQKLKREWIDTDRAIEEEFGQSIAEIFATQGEPAFRAAEAKLCGKLAAKQNLVISTGGGTLVPRANFDALSGSSSLFCLTAQPQTILERIGNAKDRPLLSAGDKSQQIARLLEDRGAAYQRIFHQIETDGVEPDRIVDKVIGLASLDELLSADTSWVKTPSEGLYPIWIKQGGLKQIGDFLEWTQARSKRLALVANAQVFELHGRSLVKALEATGFEVKHIELPDGEAHKNLETIAQLYRDLLAHKISRHDTILALGGGVTGDMAGFAAATYLRGIRFVQIPTTLLAMVDSSVGGKTGVDLPEGKNLVGAFKHPSAVLIDPKLLQTLPEAELKAGMAELIKHAIIADVPLFDELLAGATLNESHLARAVKVKIDIVAQDPLEQGRRAVLNLGHTFGHAIELVSQFSIRHGEAVGVGLVAAANLALGLKLCKADVPKRIIEALEKQGLVTFVSGMSAEAVYRAMTHDKKRNANGLRFILPRSIGDVDVFEVNNPGVILEAIESVLRPSSH